MKPWYPNRLDPTTRPWFPSKSENKPKNFNPLLDENKKAYVNKWANAIEVPSDKDFPVLSGAKSSRFPSILPTDEGAVAIQDTKTSRELGVFALMDLPAKHRVIFEKPIISFIHWRQRKGKKTIGAEWLALTPDVRSELRRTFKRLSKIRSEEYMSTTDRRTLEKFAEDYAFWDGGRSNAYIYRLVSHINHACPSCANAQHYVDCEDPHRISIRLVRNIRAGDELFIHYGKTSLTFRCALCGEHKSSDGGDDALREKVKRMADSVFRTLGIQDSTCSRKSGKTKSANETVSESVGGTTLVGKEDCCKMI